MNKIIINFRRKFFFCIIFICFSIILFLVGFLLMSKLNYYTINYVVSGGYVVDRDLTVNMNFLGDVLNNDIPNFNDDFHLLSSIISFFYFFSHIFVIYSWIFYFSSYNKKIKKTVIIVSFLVYLSISILLLFYIPFKLDRMVNRANLKYNEITQEIPTFIQEISSSLAPNYGIFLSFPIIYISIFYVFIYFSFNLLTEKYEFILHKELFFKDFYKKIISEYNEDEHWDIKETLEMWNREILPNIRIRKQIEFCETVSTFANFQGGIIIIGISNQIPRRIVGVPDIENKIKDLEIKLLRWLGNNKRFYQTKEILLKNDENQIKRCIAVIIYQTKIPVQVKKINDDISYKKRLGTGSISTNRISLVEEKKEVSKMNLNFIERMIKEYGLDY